MGTKTLDTTGLPDEAVEFIKGLVAENTLLAKNLDEATARLEDPDDDDDGDDDDDVIKGLDPKAAELVKSMEARFTAEISKAHASAAEALASANAEKAARETQEWIGKAAEYKHVGTDTTELGKALHEANATLSKSTFDTLLSALSAAEVALKESAHFKEIGKGNAGTVAKDGAQALDQAARAMMTADPKLTYPDAVVKAASADASLAKNYREGN